MLAQYLQKHSQALGLVVDNGGEERGDVAIHFGHHGPFAEEEVFVA